MLAKFDPFLSEHISRHENSGSGNTLYLSFATCDEFISILAKEVVTKILDELHEEKYFSFCVDSTPDIATNFLLQCDTRKSTVHHASTFLASSKTMVINRNNWQRLSLNVFEIMTITLTRLPLAVIRQCCQHVRVIFNSTSHGEGD